MEIPKVQPFQQHQLEQVIELWKQCGLTKPWNDPAHDIQFCVNSRDADILIITEKEKIIGTVMVGHDGHRGWVYYLAVSPDIQRSGYGRVLMESAEQWLKARNVPKLNLMIRGDNMQAIQFYQALGFIQDDVIVMGKRYFDPRN